jgi:hypothetical protein
MLLFVIHHLWSIIGDSGLVVSSILPSAVALLSFHTSTGKLGLRPLGNLRTSLGRNEQIFSVGAKLAFALFTQMVLFAMAGMAI